MKNPKHRSMALLLARLYWAESDALHYSWPAGPDMGEYEKAQEEAWRLHEEGNVVMAWALEGLSEAARERAWLESS